MNEHLSQDEIDTLLHGVDSGVVDTEIEHDRIKGEVIPYEFGSQDRIIRDRMPSLDMINERFTRYIRISMTSMLRRNIEVNVVGATMIKFSEYMKALTLPSSLNLVNINPLHGTALFVFDPDLVSATVDNYFGGAGRYPTRIEDREFTPTENRVVQLLLNLIFLDLKKSWEPVLALDYKYLSSELNPRFINIAAQNETVVVTKLNVELEGGNGEFHIVIPYSMLEPVVELLDEGKHTDTSGDDLKWTNSLMEEIKQAVVQIDSSMIQKKMTIAEVLNLTEGDIIPIDMPDMVTVRAQHVPIFRGVLGNSNGKNAVQFIEPITRPDFSNDKN